jgi:hypothetical protein
MWRSAVVRFGVLALFAATACGSSSASRSGTGSGEMALSNTSSAPVTTDMTAAYWCSIKDDGYDYPAMPCVVRRVKGRFMLAKLAGSQRFRGVVTPARDGQGFQFDGEFYCPWGDCTKPLHGVFAPTGDGRLRGTFDGDALVVTMTRADGADGGATFGGVAYGGDGYGGFGYGGLGNGAPR